MNDKDDVVLASQKMTLPSPTRNLGCIIIWKSTIIGESKGNIAKHARDLGFSRKVQNA